MCVYMGNNNLKKKKSFKIFHDLEKELKERKKKQILIVKTSHTHAYNWLHGNSDHYIFVYWSF